MKGLNKVTLPALHNKQSIGLQKDTMAGGNSLQSFLASVFLPDLFNRMNRLSIGPALDMFNGRFGSVFIHLRFSLSAQNLLTKFKNRAHFLLYLLVFESVALQRPVIRPFIKKRSVNAKGRTFTKRDLKKQLHEGLQLDGYTFSASISNCLSLCELIRFFSIFIAPHTDSTKTVPSRFVGLKIEPSSGVVSFRLASLTGLPFGFVVDDLDNSFVELKFFLRPSGFFNKSNEQRLGDGVVSNDYKARILKVVGIGLGGFILNESKDKIVDLRVRGNCLV